ncbi:hypothetical protein [Flavobacterium sp. C4GT6]|uniref:hypothetical protein n=1 Tax=Flavobacterium sp. C4GT6 TaxID=3103818 RepID=UPI002ECFEA97
MSELKNVISTLFHLQGQIHLLIETLEKCTKNENLLNQIELTSFNSDINFQKSVQGLLSNQSIIMFCSFLDEYNRYLTPQIDNSVYKDRITSLKQLNKPILKRINKWKDLYSFRNKLVAHNFRTNNKSFFSTDEVEIYKIPNTISEKILFDGIIYLICTNIRDLFPDVISQIDPDFIMLNKLKIIGEDIDNEKELTELYLQVLQ